MHNFMFLAIADYHERPLELASLRDRFIAASFSHALALGGHSGTIVLEPQGRTLHVGGEPERYARVRIFTDKGVLVGIMSCSADGQVRWQEAVRPSSHDPPG